MLQGADINRRSGAARRFPPAWCMSGKTLGKAAMSVAWYIKRLRNMDVAEMVYRLWAKARELWSRGRHEGWARYGAPAAPPPQLPGLRDRVRGADPAQRAAIAEAAANVLAGRFAALGVTWPALHAEALFPTALWRRDPVGGTDWPGAETYCFDIDFRHGPQRGDIKHIWEINRLQLLQPLAAELLLSGDARCLAAIEAAIASWHAANPPFRGVGWASGIEVALRAISLLFVTSLVGERLSAPVQRQVLEILRASAFWLPRFPSLHSSANNHLMAELAGQYLLTLALGLEGGRPRDHLLAEVQKQILADGAGAEQTPSYAAFSVELALLCALVARAAGQAFPPSFDQRIGAFAGFIDWLAGPGPTPSIGDDDEGRVLTLGLTEADYPGSVAAAIAGYLGREGRAAAAGDFRCLIFGAPVKEAALPAGRHSFAEGGLSVWHGMVQGRQAGLVFDHGALGYLSIAAHGHADALAVQLSLDGAPVLVDPGTYRYGAGGRWRDWFRGTAAHNTLNIEGADQSVIAGPFNWSSKARTTPSWLSDDRLEASHDGYAARFGVVHRRSIAVTADGLVITDRLSGATRRAELVLQLAPDCRVTVVGAAVLVQRNDETLLELRWPSADIAVEIGGEAVGAGGWVSPRFGHKLPAPRLAWRGEVGPEGVQTIIRIVPPRALDTPRL